VWTAVLNSGLKSNIRPVLRTRELSAQEFLDMAAKADKLSRNVGNFHPTLGIIPKERGPHSQRGVNTKSCNCRLLQNLKGYQFHRHGSWKINTVELHLSGLIGTEWHPDMQKIRNIGFSLTIGYSGNLKFGYLCLNLSTTPDLTFQKPQKHLIW
jgi:hypothetical protein